MASPEFLEGVRRICDEEGILLLFDEIQCGMDGPERCLHGSITV